MSNDAQLSSLKINRKVSFVEKNEVPTNYNLTKVLDSDILRSLYKNDLFEVKDIADVNTNDFVFVVGYGLFQIKNKEV